ncbi:MAG TPA: MarR family transcriptional regulator [Candidatus Saccharimonadales bacterium]|jgi:DNA-binding MarR family transcriptional regulator|nr:MarR family transcriptional regulator [Candidatus Saccharimonadales bacterium]
MAKLSKKELERQVIMGAREYGISTVLFRNAVSDKLGVNVTDMECLALLFFKGIASPTELSKYTGLSSGATTAMLDRLEKAKLIKRQPNPHDRRGVLIVVEKSSVKTVGPMFAGTRKDQDELVASYSEKELEIIADFFKRFTAVWEQGRKKLQI